MSFDNLSQLNSQVQHFSRYSDSPKFDIHVASLSAQISQINNTVSRLTSLLGQIGGRRDSETLRADVKKLLVETRGQFKLTGEAVKKAQSWQDLSHSQHYASQKLSDAFSTLLRRFRSLRRASAEKTSQCLLGTSTACQAQCQSQSQLAVTDQSEVDLQESVVLQRGQEIQLLQEGIEDINDIYKSLVAIVSMQGENLDTVERNVNSTAEDIKNADYELRQANKWQRRARKRSCCLLLLSTIVFGIVVLAVWIPHSSGFPPHTPI